MKPLIAVLGATATGKSALGIALAERLGGEILNCDSTAVYRGFDIGTDKVPMAERRGIPHHLIDIADPTDEYTAAQFARDATATIRDIHARGLVPILVGGTGFYYRALTRGLFPGPAADAPLRARLEAIAATRGVERLHRLVARVDPESAVRIMPRDLMRLVRALEVYFLTGRPLTAHFEETVSLLDPDVQGSDTPNLVADLARYGAKVGNDLVIEDSPVSQQMNLPPYILMLGEPAGSFGSHPIVDKLHSFVIFEGSRSVSADAVPGREVTELIQTSEYAWAETDLDPATPKSPILTY